MLHIRTSHGVKYLLYPSEQLLPLAFESCVISYIRMSHVTHMRESCHLYERVMGQNAYCLPLHNCRRWHMCHFTCE